MPDQLQLGNRGDIALDPGDRLPLLRLWPLALGTLVLAALWLGPLPSLSRTAFSPHMILHLGIVAVASPLLAAGLIRTGIVFAPGAPFAWAIAASLVEMLVVWGWHAPRLHEAAALHRWVFAVQQLSFLAAGLGIWLIALAARTGAAAAAGGLALLMTFVHMTMLGIVLTLAPVLLYPPDICLGAFGFDRLGDQRFGGVLMAVVGGLPYLCGGIFLFGRLLSAADRAAPP